MTDTEGIDALVNRAEVLLSLVGDPTERVEMLLTAQTSVLLALVMSLKRDEPSTNQLATAVSLEGAAPLVAHAIKNTTGHSLETIAHAMNTMERQVPLWTTTPIHAIREVRASLSISLRDAKDLIDNARDDLPNKWWV